jgi:hypothetical protein
MLPQDELERRQKLVPPDTRDFTQRFLGDPIPGDMRRELFPGSGTTRQIYNAKYYRERSAR